MEVLYACIDRRTMVASSIGTTRWPGFASLGCQFAGTYRLRCGAEVEVRRKKS